MLAYVNLLETWQPLHTNIKTTISQHHVLWQQFLQQLTIHHQVLITNSSSPAAGHKCGHTLWCYKQSKSSLCLNVYLETRLLHLPKGLMASQFWFCNSQLLLLCTFNHNADENKVAVFSIALPDLARIPKF